MKILQFHYNSTTKQSIDILIETDDKTRTTLSSGMSITLKPMWKILTFHTFMDRYKQEHNIQCIEWYYNDDVKEVKIIS